jgi:Holliday junction DNA helicase RuvA
MIGKLRGTIDSIGEDFVILDVHGVGYVVNCSTRTLQNLPAAGEAAALAIETQVREDSIRLYGFLSDDERDWFRLLQTVQGVGAKVALALLGILSTSELGAAIARQDKTALATAAAEAPAVQDAIAALISLDYSRQQAANAVAVARAELGEAAEAPALIRRSLKELAR